MVCNTKMQKYPFAYTVQAATEASEKQKFITTKICKTQTVILMAVNGP